MDDDGLMTIEQLASQAGTATSTVRLYQTRACCPRPYAGAVPATTGRVTGRGCG